MSDLSKRGEREGCENLPELIIYCDWTFSRLVLPSAACSLDSRRSCSSVGLLVGRHTVLLKLPPAFFSLKRRDYLGSWRRRQLLVTCPVRVKLPGKRLSGKIIKQLLWFLFFQKFFRLFFHLCLENRSTSSQLWEAENSKNPHWID